MCTDVGSVCTDVGSVCTDVGLLCVYSCRVVVCVLM